MPPVPYAFYVHPMPLPVLPYTPRPYTPFASPPNIHQTMLPMPYVCMPTTLPLMPSYALIYPHVPYIHNACYKWPTSYHGSYHGFQVMFPEWCQLQILEIVIMFKQ